MSDGKKKMLIVADTPDWAFAREVNAVVKYLGAEYEFTKAYFSEKREAADACGYTHISDIMITPENFDMVLLKGILPFPFAKLDGFSPARVAMNVGSNHYFEYPNFIAKFAEALPRFRNLFCVSEALVARVKAAVPDRNVFYTPQGVDLDAYPQPAVTIGWAGNVTHMGDHKRIKETILPVADRFKGDARFKFRFAVVGATGDVGTAMSELGIDYKTYTLDEMPGYYASIDMLMNASKMESICHPIIESACTGKWVISTDVGYASAVIIEGVNGNIVPPTIEAFVAAIEAYYNRNHIIATRRELAWSCRIAFTRNAIESVLAGGTA